MGGLTWTVPTRGSCSAPPQTGALQSRAGLVGGQGRGGISAAESSVPLRTWAAWRGPAVPERSKACGGGEKHLASIMRMEVAGTPPPPQSWPARWESLILQGQTSGGRVPQTQSLQCSGAVDFAPPTGTLLSLPEGGPLLTPPPGCPLGRKEEGEGRPYLDACPLQRRTQTEAAL